MLQHQLLLRSALHGLGRRRLALWKLMGGGAEFHPGIELAAHVPLKNMPNEFLRNCNKPRCGIGAGALQRQAKYGAAV
jgi:hypothetical protein